MKRTKILLFLLIIPVCFLCACNNKSFEYQVLERDIYNTGGNLTFVYDDATHTAIFGGEGETVQFYTQDIAKGWAEEGCRIGIRILAPNGLKEYKSASATLDDEELTSKDFFIETNGNVQFAVFQPIVSKEKSQVDLKITWQEGYEKQIYHIIIKEGTIFMEKNI